jgi:hypothetical protein
MQPCQYVNVEEAALDGLYRIAEAKLSAEHQKNAPETAFYGLLALD